MGWRPGRYLPSNASVSSFINQRKGLWLLWLPAEHAWLGEQRMGWFHPYSRLQPAPLCQVATAAGRPFGAVLMVGTINERKVPGSVPAWHMFVLALSRQDKQRMGAEEVGGDRARHPVHVCPLGGPANTRDSNLWSHRGLRAEPGSGQSRAPGSVERPPGHMAQVWKPAGRRLPLRLKGECGQFSGMSLLGL